MSNDDVVEGFIDAAEARETDLDYHGVVGFVWRSSSAVATAVLAWVRFAMRASKSWSNLYSLPKLRFSNTDLHFPLSR